jgi:uncharacterized protein (DUF342 family)
LAVLRGLIDLLSDPHAARERIDELTAATTKHDEARAAAKEASAALKAEQEAARAAMAAEQEAHRRALSDEQLKLNDEINQKRNALARDEAAVQAAKTEAENDAARAVELRARWQKKVDAIDAGLRA